MTKQQPCATLLRPSRLCRILLVAVALKLCLISAVLIDPVTNAVHYGISLFAGKKTVAAQQVTPHNSSPVALTTATADASVKIPSVFQTPSAHAAPAAPAAPAAQPSADPSSNLAREALARRQEELARKEQDLQTLSKDLDDRLERLQALEMRLKTMLKDAEEVKSGKFRQLIDMLANMKAKQAAAVLETLDERIAVKVLSGMRGRQSGEILTFVNPTKAARLSEALARVQLPFE